MAVKLGLLGVLSIQSSSSKNAVSVTPGFIASPFEKKRIFSTGNIMINHFRIDNARIFWDTGAKQTFVYVPNYDLIDARPLCSFPVSGIGASENAQAYCASIDLGGGIVVNNIIIGALLSDEPADHTVFDSADVILGMDVIEHGSLRIDGENHKWAFIVK